MIVIGSQSREPAQEPRLLATFEARKQLFVDLLKWGIPARSEHRVMSTPWKAMEVLFITSWLVGAAAWIYGTRFFLPRRLAG